MSLSFCFNLARIFDWAPILLLYRDKRNCQVNTRRLSAKRTQSDLTVSRIAMHYATR